MKDKNTKKIEPQNNNNTIGFINTEPCQQNITKNKLNSKDQTMKETNIKNIRTHY